MAPAILLLDPDPRLLEETVSTLRARGFETRVETDLEHAQEALAGGDFDVVLAETRVFGALLPTEPLPAGTQWILLDTFGLLTGGLGARRKGAFDVLPRPVQAELAILSVERALEHRRNQKDLIRLRAAAPEYRFGPLVSRSARLEEVFGVCERVAGSRASVLITGESGTGKSELARALHQGSNRRDAPWVEVHCGALVGTLLESELFGHAAGAFTGARAARAGKFESAHGGTLFLDELATASLDLQIKLLRVLETGRLERVGETQTRQVDVRLLAATNVDLADEVRAGRFREDLFWRIQVVALKMPGLRERPEDIELLAQRFLEEALVRHGRKRLSIGPRAMDLLRRHTWPGNVRELRQTMERAALLSRGPELSETELRAWWDLGPSAPAMPRGLLTSESQGTARSAEPASTTSPRDSSPLDSGATSTWERVPLGPLAQMLLDPERRFLERALEATGGSRKRTAELLGITRSTLFNKLRKHGLQELSREAAEQEDLPAA